MFFDKTIFDDFKTYGQKLKEHFGDAESTRNTLEEIHAIISKTNKTRTVDTLCRYRGKERGLTELSNESIYLAPILSFQDPFDTLIPFEQIVKQFEMQIPEYNRHSLKTTMDNFAIAIPFLLKDYKFGIKQLMRKNSSNGTFDLISSTIRNNLNVSCFTEEHDSFVMWDRYANGHDGICIEYDTNKLSKNGINCYSVTYSNELNIDFTTGSDEFIRLFQGIVRCILTKNTDYSYEKEWRTFSGTPNKNVLSTKDAISRVYLGTNISEKIKKKTIKLCNSKDIEIIQMIASNDNYIFDEKGV